MKTFAYTIELQNDPDVIKAYKEYHKNVYPEVLATGKRQGIHSQQIYLAGNRLFMIMVAEDQYDPNGDYLENERCRKWDEQMRSYQVPLSYRKPEEWWMRMELVFDREWYK